MTAEQQTDRTLVRRQEILRAAAEVISGRGVCEARIADIAERAGVSAGLVVYYFESRDRLLAEALDYAETAFYQQIIGELETLDSARDQLVRLIQRSCPPDGGAEELADWTLWLELWSRALRDPVVAERREQLDRRWRSVIADIVRAGRRSLEFAPVDVDEFALRLSTMMDGLAVQVMLGDRDVTSQRMLDVTLGMAARELGFKVDLAEPPPPSSSAAVAAS
jgi:AcrR family transcriptional regulator